MTYHRLLDRLVPPVLCLLAAIVATWPLLPAIASALPLGTEHEATVPLFNLWTLWWDADRVPHGFLGLWNAPIFHPLEGTFTFSEPMLLQGVTLSPLWWMGVPPAAIYNLAILGTLVCNGLATRSLARALGAPRGAALLAALAGVTLPYTAKVLGVLPVLPLFGTIWALAALIRFGKEGGWRPAALAILSFAAQFLAGEQMALLSLPFLLLAGLVALTEQRFRARSIATLGALAILGALVLSPIASTVSSFHEKYGFTRSEEVVAALSAQARDFTTRPSSSRLAFPPREDSYAGDTGGLFPGFLLLGLGVAGAWLGWRQGERRLWIVCLLVCVAVGGLLALGLNLRIGDWRPFASLREVVPGLRTLRSPFRAVAISQAVLAALAALALARLASWRGNDRQDSRSRPGGPGGNREPRVSRRPGADPRDPAHRLDELVARAAGEAGRGARPAAAWAARLRLRGGGVADVRPDRPPPAAAQRLLGLLSFRVRYVPGGHGPELPFRSPPLHDGVRHGCQHPDSGPPLPGGAARPVRERLLAGLLRPRIQAIPGW